MDPMASIRDTFFQECEEQLTELEAGLMAVDAGDAGAEVINSIFRAVHSIKGGAGAFALEQLVRFAHVFETALDELRAGRLEADRVVVKTMLQAADLLADLVRSARDEATLDPARVDALAAALRSLNGAAAAEADGTGDADGDEFSDLDFEPVAVVTEAAAPADEAAAAPWLVRFRPHADMYRHANDAVLLLRELRRLGTVAVELDRASLPPLAELEPASAYLSWTVTLPASCSEAEIRDVFEFVDGECDLQLGRAGAPPAASGDGPAPEAGVDIAALLMRAVGAGTGEQTASGATAPAPPPDTAVPVRREPDQPAAAAPPPAAATADKRAANAESSAPTIRVDLTRVDRLIDLVGELVINEAMLSQRVLDAGLGRASGMTGAMDALGQLTREIQDSVMAIRAQPVRSVFQRMPRLVREVAAMTGKQVRLVTEGENTEVDKTVIERLADPLTHMIRNAIDHGLESTEKRRAAGKPEEGTVRLCALHRSGRIVIEVSDDGAGIDRARVRAKAAANGLIAADAALSDDETDNLIFMAGFSTAETISDISGRGVGMDVVKRSVQALGGRISISSVPGQGSTFTLSLPLTLAVLDGMVVSVAGHTLILPLSPIIETLLPRSADLHAIGTDAKVLALRGGYVPIVDVGTVLGYRDQPDPARPGVALLVEAETGQRGVFLVDEIRGQRQIVIKSLETNYRAVPGIAAATVMGDGRVALILDVDAIFSMSRPAGGTVNRKRNEQYLEAVA